MVDGHYLPSPGLGVRASKMLHVDRKQSAPRDPELLQKLLFMVRQGLRGAEPGSFGYTEHRLDVFRRAFGHYISAYISFSPLLLGVQEAYEDALAQATARATGADDATGRLSLMQDEAQQLLEHLHNDAGEEKAAMLKMVAERDARLRDKDKENEKLKMEVKRLSNEMVHHGRLREDMEVRCADMQKQLEHWQHETAEARRQADDQQKEVEKVRRDLKEMANRERMLLEEDKEQRQLFRETKESLESLRASSVNRESFKQVDDQLKRANASLKAAKAEVDELKRLLAGGESHALYPNGLQWADTDLDVAYLDPGWRGKKPHAIIADLVLDLLTLYHARQMSAGGARGGGEPAQMFSLEAADLRGVGAANAAAAEPTEPAGAIKLLQGEQTKARGIASSFDGFIRVRPGLWSVEAVREAVKRLWTSYRKHPRVLTLQGGARRALPPSERFMRPEIVQEMMSELMTTFLSHRHDEAVRHAEYGAGEKVAEQRPTSKRDMHKHTGLLCSDTYNLQAAMWALRDTEPQAAMFVQVAFGRLPPGIFAELHKMCSGLYRSVAAVAKNEKAPLDAVRAKLATALPGCPEGDRELLIAMLLKADGGRTEGHSERVGGSSSLRIKHLEPSHKEPCEGRIASSGMVAIQKFFLVEALRLRDDLEGALKRMATSKFFAEPSMAVNAAMQAPSPSAPPPLASDGGSAMSKAANDLRGAMLAAVDLRTAMTRVDAEVPATAVEDHVHRVFSKPNGSAPTDGGGDGGGDGGEDEHLPLDEVCARLFAEPLRRFTPRTNEALCEGVTTALKAGDKGGKKAKGKKKKGGDAGEAMVSLQRLKDALVKADGSSRPPIETEFVAASVFAAARRLAAERPAQPASPPSSPRPGGPPSPEIAEDEAPMDTVLDALKDTLLQRLG